MGVVTYAPGCVVSWTSNAAPGNQPVRLSKVLHADTVISLAPSVGTANIVVADPDGQWVSSIKPNDTIVVVFSSRQSRGKNLGQLAPGPESSWCGLVNSAQTAYDPRTQYGRACEINAWTYLKPMVITSVPLQFFFNAQYPKPEVPLIALLLQAQQSCVANTGVPFGIDYSQASVPLQTSATNVPNDADVPNPAVQSWMAYLSSLLTAAGTESYAREDGTIVVRDFQGMTNPDPSKLPSIPAEELFSSKGAGVSDLDLRTNVIVSWSVHPQTRFAAVAPNNGLASIGPLPPQLLDASGNPLPQIGKRFALYTADFLGAAADAERYATNVRSVGLAKVDTFQAAVALNGDLRIGTDILVPAYNRRYYVTTVGHFFEDQVDAETNITGCFGVPPDYVWNLAAMQGATTIPTALAQANGTFDDPTITSAKLPLPDDPSDPDVRWLPGMQVISTSDIQRVLQAKASPFTDQSAHIWSKAKQSGVNPAFALAVWQVECQQGTDPNAVTDITNHNPGSIGVTSTDGGGAVYATWQDGIDAWYQLIDGSLYLGAGNLHVSQIAAVYDPENAAAWASEVTSNMLAYIGQAAIPVVTTPGVPPPGATGSMAAAAAYAAQLAQSIPANGDGIHNVIVAGTALGTFVRAAGYGDVECTVFVEYLMAKVASIAGIVDANSGAIANGPNAAQWGGYLTGLGFSAVTGGAPLPGDVLLFEPGETNPQTGSWTDLSEGQGHVGVITAVTPPDHNDQGGVVTMAGANTPDPIDTWTLLDAGGTYQIGGLTGRRFFGATPFAWYRHS